MVLKHKLMVLVMSIQAKGTKPIITITDHTNVHKSEISEIIKSQSHCFDDCICVVCIVSVIVNWMTSTMKTGTLKISVPLGFAGARSNMLLTELR